MKILTGKQIKELDLFTIENEPVASLALIERASESMAQAICNEVEEGSELTFFIGKGNNGGDGLAIARMLSNAGFYCKVVMLYDEKELSEEAKINYDRLPDVVQVTKIDGVQFSEQAILIDAMLGSGTSSDPVKDPVATAIRYINSLPNKVISIDMPSRMRTEFGNDPDDIVHADVTLTIEFPKLAMMLPEVGDCCGRIEVMAVDLSSDYIDGAETDYNYITEDFVEAMIRPRSKFSYKNNYGHALLICGSYGMCGAAILSASGALRSGCGLVTVHVPERDSNALYASVPSALLSLDKNVCFASLPKNVNNYTSVGVGCGIGTEDVTADALWRLVYSFRKPIVFDADAIKIAGNREDIMSLIPEQSVFTPHLGELRYLIGDWSDEQDKISKAKEFAKKHKSVLVVKGSNTMVCLADGTCYFNSTGTPGMAKAGSGDVLTGLITGLIARGYSSAEAAVLGVYFHGKAGEKAAEYYGIEGMNSGDLADFIAEAMHDVNK